MDDELDLAVGDGEVDVFESPLNISLINEFLLEILEEGLETLLVVVDVGLNLVEQGVLFVVGENLEVWDVFHQVLERLRLIQDLQQELCFLVVQVEGRLFEDVLGQVFILHEDFRFWELTS